jgi:hypothetical protein
MKSSQSEDKVAASFGWSDLSNAAMNVNHGNNMGVFDTSSSFALNGELQESVQPQNPYGADAPDLWQAPLNFEWDQWEAYVERFPGESLNFNET